MEQESQTSNKAKQFYDASKVIKEYLSDKSEDGLGAVWKEHIAEHFIREYDEVFKMERSGLLTRSDIESIAKRAAEKFVSGLAASYKPE